MPFKRVCLDQRADALFEKEWISVFWQQLLQAEEAYVVTHKIAEELFSSVWRQPVEMQLRVVALAAPMVRILRTVCQDHQKRRGGQTIDQSLQECLCFAVDPVQVLERQKHGLLLAFAKDQTLEGIERALAALE